MRAAFLAVALTAAATALTAESSAELLAALSSASAAATVTVTRSITLDAPLVLASPVTLVGAAGAALLLDARAGGSVVTVLGVRGVTLRGLRVAYVGDDAGGMPPRAAALTVFGSTDVVLNDLVVEGGVVVAGSTRVDVSWSDVSNAQGAARGNCVYVTGCGNSSTLEPCGVVVHDNVIHDCRWAGGNTSVYSAAAQGVLVGAAGTKP